MVGYLVIAYAILPFIESREQVGVDLKHQERMLKASLRTIQQRDRYAAMLDEVQKVLDQYRVRLLDARDVDSANTELDELVRGLANQNKVTLVKSNPLQERKTEGRYTKVTVQINLEGDMSATVAFLHSLGAHQKFLLVEDLFLNKFRVQTNQIQPRMNISAFIRLS